MTLNNIKITCAIVVAVAFPTAALANQTGTHTSAWFPTAQQAISVSQTVSENICAPYGGLQSFTVHNVLQNAGYYAVRFTYVCNE